MKTLIEKIISNRGNGQIRRVVTEFLGLGWDYLTDEDLAKSIKQECRKESNKQLVCEIMRY